MQSLRNEPRESKKMARPRKSSGRMASKGFPNPIDVHVGSRIRLRRTLLGMSQERLAEAIGLTFQQVQKYERGANRIGSSRLYQLSQVLDVPVSYFFDDMPAHAVQAGQRRGLGETPPAELSPRWRGLEDRRNPLIRYVPWWVVGAAALAALGALAPRFTAA